MTMKPLNLIFKLLKPENKVTKLSSSFSRWESCKHRKKVLRYEADNGDSHEYFKVYGAGNIAISKSSNYQCRVNGFAFGVSWGRHQYAGGVLGKEEAIRLALFILENSLYDSTKHY
jgi:hypothetical protein